MFHTLPHKVRHQHPQPQMDAYTACGLVEGFEEADSEEEVIEAWQFLIDTGLAWKLQGRIGRQAAYLIESGICHISH